MRMPQTVERHHNLIIMSLVAVILALVVTCTFDEATPLCHWIFRCG
jgi:hypothetical protein